jgi:hypothetical protein
MITSMANTKKNKAPAPLNLTREELVIINNALNEVVNGISLDDDEFQTRLGYSRAKAENVRKKVAKSLGK